MKKTEIRKAWEILRDAISEKQKKDRKKNLKAGLMNVYNHSRAHQDIAVYLKIIK